MISRRNQHEILKDAAPPPPGKSPRPSQDNRRHDCKEQQPIQELVGSAYVFVSAVGGVMEEILLAETAGRRLTPSQLRILKLLHLTDARNVGDVAAFLGVSDAAASKALDRLVRRKYIRRAEVPSDRRSSELSLTASGRSLLGQYEAAKNRKLAKVFRAFRAKDLRYTALFLERLTKEIVLHSAHPEEICLQCGIHLRKRCLVREAASTGCSYLVRKNKR